MTRARKTLVSLDDTPYYHCISRCVRRAFLWGNDEFAGKDYSHRKHWVVERLKVLAKVFAIDLCAYAVMANHYHLVVRINRERAQEWSEGEVIEHWSTLYGLPLLITRYRTEEAQSPAEQDQAREIIGQWRERLHDLSWYMRALNEHLARKANAEDQCTGRFWEGRFKSQALLDEAGLLTCMAYVDLNPIRAGIAHTPETSEFTSVYERIQEWQGTAAKETPHKGSVDNTTPSFLATFRQAKDDIETGIPFSLTDYLELLDWTGRAIREDKRGFIPSELPPILQRLNASPQRWLKHMQPQGNRFGRAIGRLHSLRRHAQTMGRHWVQGLTLSARLFPVASG